VEAGEAAQRREEDLLGHVLREMMVAQLVESERIHLSDILPVQRFELAGISARLFDAGSIGVERDQSLPFPCSL
jgi:hypothetical protein